jgi:hypothetical protein
MSQHEAQKEARPKRVVMNWDRCPACDGSVQQIKCKLICTGCHTIIENCSGD